MYLKYFNEIANLKKQPQCVNSAEVAFNIPQRRVWLSKKHWASSPQI